MTLAFLISSIVHLITNKNGQCSYSRDNVVHWVGTQLSAPSTFSNLPCTSGKRLQALTTHYYQSHSTPVNSTSPQLAKLSPTEPYVVSSNKEMAKKGPWIPLHCWTLVPFPPCCYLLYRECTLFIKLSRLMILIPFISFN